MRQTMYATNAQTAVDSGKTISKPPHIDAAKPHAMPKAAPVSVAASKMIERARLLAIGRS